MDRESRFTIDRLEFCPDCGAPLAGYEDCQSIWDEITAKVFSNPSYGRTYNLGFDAYCMQHPRYTRSAKSFAAHLTRLCCGLEFKGDPEVYAAIRGWLDGKIELEKPVYLEDTGAISAVDLLGASDSAEHHERVDRWAREVWRCYTDHHDLARAWIHQALKQTGRHWRKYVHETA